MADDGSSRFPVVLRGLQIHLQPRRNVVRILGQVQVRAGGVPQDDGTTRGKDRRLAKVGTVDDS